MTEGLVSIIIPAYNSSKTIEKSVLSALKQSYLDIEVIIIDDGSTDTTASIIDRIASTNEKVKVIHNANNGVSNARNTGIEHANGEYIGFLDADDQMGYYMIEILHQAAILHNADLVCCEYALNDKYLCNNTNSEYCWHLVDQKWLDKEILVPKHHVEAFVWNKLYNRNFIKKYNIKFDERVKVCEDTLFNYQCNAHALVRVYVPLQLYYYNINSESTMFSNTFNYKKLTANIAYDEMKKICCENNLDKYTLSTAITIYNLILYKQALTRKDDLQKNEIMEIGSRILEPGLSFLLSGAKLKYKFAYFAVRIIHSRNKKNRC